MDELIYSILPTVTAALFLGFGIYILYRKGITSISSSFFILCLTTFFWQCTWALLFQIHDSQLGLQLSKFGYLLIFFLPTSLYHFLTEITGWKTERRWVLVSYAVASIFAVLLLTTDLFVAGTYDYFWGFYPKAGILHPLHIAQTVIVVSRGLYITYKAQQTASAFHRIRLRYCLISLLIYFFAAVDYLCNYGIEFYPPGVIFLTISLAIMTVAIVKYKLMDNPAVLAATIAHEMRTPLSTISLQAQAINRFWPELIRGYQLAQDNHLLGSGLQNAQLQQLQTMAEDIADEVTHAQTLIDVILASANQSLVERYAFSEVSIQACIEDVVQDFPFHDGEEQLVHIQKQPDFHFYGSANLMRYTLYNLLKNALYAIKQAGKGEIRLVTEIGEKGNRLIFTDTGPGIPSDILPHIFDDFFSTKAEGKGSGIGLAFCRRVMQSFNGNIECRSKLGESTQFILSFAQLADHT